MTTKSDHLAEIRQAFARCYAPRNSYDRHDFEVGLDRLIYTAFAVAQEPFIKELEMFRDHALKTAALGPIGHTSPPTT